MTFCVTLLITRAITPLYVHDHDHDILCFYMPWGSLFSSWVIGIGVHRSVSVMIFGRAHK
jgi:hypothetical protein